MIRKSTEILNSGMLILIVSAFFISGCKIDTSGRQQQDTDSSGRYIKISGKTMGTTYHITYESNPRVKQESIDRLLLDINQSVSTYVPSSEISQFNQGTGPLLLMSVSGEKATQQMKSTGQITPVDSYHHFESNLRASQIIFDQSDRLFDPTVMPLVNYWGFGYQGHDAVAEVNHDTVALLRQAVGLDGVSIERIGQTVVVNKDNPKTQIDFSAIAKGYAVDIIIQYLQSCMVNNALVEIGGETATLGLNASHLPWTIGINTPSTQASIYDFEVIVNLSNVALASSGNYRNYRLIDGKRYGHEISPVTGYPTETEVLSASVIAPTCQRADGYATACMIMGVEKCLDLVERLDGVEVILITDKEGKEYELHYSSGFGQYLADK